uniref:Uncharacterized protein n=1 Tax=Glossina austeni TaxID=7395 RepID=A0A1A9V965_GLOAU
MVSYIYLCALVCFLSYVSLICAAVVFIALGGMPARGAWRTSVTIGPATTKGQLPLKAVGKSFKEKSFLYCRLQSLLSPQVEECFCKKEKKRPKELLLAWVSTDTRL